MSMTLADFLLVTAAATIGAAIVFFALKMFDLRQRKPAEKGAQAESGPVFLFEENILVDATSDATAMIAPHTEKMTDLEAALHVLSAHFPTLPDIVRADRLGTVQIEGEDALWVELSRTETKLRIAVKGLKRQIASGPSNIIEHDIRMAELSMLRELLQFTPQLVWSEDKSGKLLWANHAYLAFSDKVFSASDDVQCTWPSAPLFPELHEALLTNGGASVRRIAIPLRDKKSEHWFDVTSTRRDDGFLHFATDANAVVRAEQAQRNFMQTLGKTFAQISIGLAIFDKRRQLATFNPALLDMTNLPFEFLSGRPTVDMVLDRLRESRMLPEPKNYTSWRDQFNALETAAKDGTYSENWNLPDGQIYRVTGRPHPDGAVAFLFEDISAEVSLTRRFRSDIETGQAVLDTLPDAIAVFSGAGTLVMSNKAYADIWGTVIAGGISHQELRAEIKVWQSRCTATPVWAELRNFIHQIGERKPWAKGAILDDGRHITCHANAIHGGMTMVKFSFKQSARPAIQKLTQGDSAKQTAKR